MIGERVNFQLTNESWKSFHERGCKKQPKTAGFPQRHYYVAEAEKFKTDESLKVKSNSCDHGEDGYVFVPKFG